MGFHRINHCQYEAHYFDEIGYDVWELESVQSAGIFIIWGSCCATLAEWLWPEEGLSWLQLVVNQVGGLARSRTI